MMAVKKIINLAVLGLSTFFVWEVLFFANTLIKPILWEIHTIYTLTLLTYVFLFIRINDAYLDVLKVGLRVSFRVWLIIILAFVMQNRYKNQPLILTFTFVFGYLEGLIDLNAWLKNSPQKESKLFNTDEKMNRLYKTLFYMHFIHILSALFAFVISLFLQ